MENPIKLLTVDDNETQASAMKKHFDDCGFIKYLGNISSPERCIERVRNDRSIDLILIDYYFPNSSINGEDLVKELRKVRPFKKNGERISAPRILFSSVESKGYVDIENGIYGLIPKNTDITKVLEMVRLVHENEITIPIKVNPTTNKGARPGFIDKLTPREMEVFCLVIKGKKNHEIIDFLPMEQVDIDRGIARIRTKIVKSGFKFVGFSSPKLKKMLPDKLSQLIFWKELSKREQKIVKLLVEGNSRRDLTSILKLSIDTIHKHRSKILGKINDEGYNVNRIDDPKIVRLDIKFNFCNWKKN